MDRIFRVADNKCGKLSIHNDFELTYDFAKIMGQMANDFMGQLVRITESSVNQIKNTNADYYAKELKRRARVDDLQNILEMVVEFYFMQAEYIKNNSMSDNEKKAASVCKKAISIMLSYNIYYSSIPYEIFESPYQWLLYVSLLATLPIDLKNRVEIVAEYKDKSFNYFNDICIIDKLTNNLIVRIECDGKKNHYDTEENYERHCIRQNDMMIHDDYKILRYVNKRIYYENFHIAQQIWDFVFKQLSEFKLNIKRTVEPLNSVFENMQKSNYETNDTYKPDVKKEFSSDYKNLNFITKIKLLFKFIKL